MTTTSVCAEGTFEELSFEFMHSFFKGMYAISEMIEKEFGKEKAEGYEIDLMTSVIAYFMAQKTGHDGDEDFFNKMLFGASHFLRVNIATNKPEAKEKTEALLNNIMELLGIGEDEQEPEQADPEGDSDGTE